MLSPSNLERVEPKEGSTNTMISALSPEKQPHSDNGAIASPLTSTQRRNNVVDAYNDLIDVVNMYFQPGLGCKHCRTEWFMSQGCLRDKGVWKHPPECMEPCITHCFVCDKSIRHWILPIVYEGAMEFMDSDCLIKGLPTIEIDHTNGDEILDLLAKDGDWLLRVFGKKTVTKYHVASFFLQLIAAEILSFEWKNGKVVCGRNRDRNVKLLFKHKIKWEGFTFRTKAQGRAMKFLTFKEIYAKDDYSDVIVTE